MPNQSDTSENKNNTQMQELRLWVPVFLADWLKQKAKENYFSTRGLYVRHLLLGIYRRENGR
jgi:hypothetical protein